MRSVATTRILLFLAGVILVPSMTYLVILFARGYRLNFRTKQVQVVGFVAVTSSPDGAQIFVNNQLRGATNSTLTLPPGTYQIEIRKDSYSPWKKTVLIEAEIVSRAAGTLFPSIPSLKAITGDGAILPTLSPNGTKVAFVKPTLRQTEVYILDLSESPLGLVNREARLAASLPLPNPTLVVPPKPLALRWSPDSRQIVAVASPAAYLVDPAANPPYREITASLTTVLKNWQVETQKREAQKLIALPKSLQDILATSAAELAWSPQEDKLMYTATISATIPSGLIKPLPGSSSQTEQRRIEPGTVYTYDLEEDRNFAVGSVTDPPLTWFPDSYHLVRIENKQIVIMEYDGTNPTVVYAGPMDPGFAQSYPSGKQILILTNLSPTLSSHSNLYAVSLR